MAAIELLKEYEGKDSLQCVEDSFIILYHNGEFEVFNGTLENAIQHVKTDDRYNNYGHNGATIIAYRQVFHIKNVVVEKTSIQK